MIIDRIGWFNNDSKIYYEVFHCYLVDVVDFPDFVFDYQEALLTEDSGFFFIKFFVDTGLLIIFFLGIFWFWF